MVSLLAWPNEWVILVGSFLATTGAGLQSLISAPRLLYAISKDNLVPALNPFSTLSASGEPTRALIATLGNYILLINRFLTDIELSTWDYFFFFFLGK